MAGVRLPVRTHPLHAFVTNDYAQGLPDHPGLDRARLLRLADRARPDAHRRRVRRAAVVLAPVVVRLRCARTPARVTRLLPFLRDLRILRQWAGICDISVDFSPIMSATAGRRLLRHDRLGHVGLQGHPGRRRGHGRAHRDGPAAGAHRAVRARPIPARPRPGRPGLGGDALMHWLDCPRCGRRPLDEFVFGGERRPVPDVHHRPRRARLRRGLDLRQPRRPDDRALVPRGRLPALADRPPRHRDATSSWRCADVPSLADRTARAAAARPRPVRRRGDRARSRRSSARRRRARAFHRHRPRRRARPASSTASVGVLEAAGIDVAVCSPTSSPTRAPLDRRARRRRARRGSGSTGRSSCRSVAGRRWTRPRRSRLHAANGGDVAGPRLRPRGPDRPGGPSSPCRRPPGPAPRPTPTASSPTRRPGARTYIGHPSVLPGRGRSSTRR